MPSSWLKRLFSCPPVRATSVQRVGATGPDVVLLQRRLNRYGRRYKIQVEVTGVYDDQTRNGVQTFQLEALGMSTDGFIGPLTARRLHLTLIE